MKQRLPSYLISPVILVMLLDFLFTEIGQPAAYWQNTLYVNEGSPLGFNLLRNGVIWFPLFSAFVLFRNTK